MSGPNTLYVVDNRTGKTYTVPIDNNSVPATAFKAIKAPRGPGDREENETEAGLRVLDAGFMNTVTLAHALYPNVPCSTRTLRPSS
jgi:citrate synthase